MFDFSRPVIEACGHSWPRLRVSGRLVHKVMSVWRETKMNDFYASGTLRADGRYVHDMYLMEVKKPSESTKPWDYYKVVKKIPGEQIFTTKAESKCALWK